MLTSLRSRAILAAAVLVAVPVLATPSAAVADLASGNTLGAGQKIVAGSDHDHLTSRSGEFELRVVPGTVTLWQTVHYRGIEDTFTTDSWFRQDPNGDLPPRNDASVLMLKRDGNLVLRLADTIRVWASGTAGSGAVRLRLTDGGNLLLQNAKGKTVWASGSGRVVARAGDTLAPGARLVDAWNTAFGPGYPRQQLVMQRDGNLVWKCGAAVKWQTRTHRTGSYLLVTRRGPLQVRGPGGKVLWSSRNPRHTTGTVLNTRSLALTQYNPTTRYLWEHPGLSCD